MLSGDARNVCDHGVLCLSESRRSAGLAESRESLNLRFGLHTPAFAYKEIYKQFDTERKQPVAKKPPKPRAEGTRKSRRIDASKATEEGGDTSKAAEEGGDTSKGEG